MTEEEEEENDVYICVVYRHDGRIIMTGNKAMPGLITTTTTGSTTTTTTTTTTTAISTYQNTSPTDHCWCFMVTMMASSITMTTTYTAAAITAVTFKNGRVGIKLAPPWCTLGLQEAEEEEEEEEGGLID